jgi:hypothetical protein
MRLSQREQIVIQQAADNFPGPLADWLKEWVVRQQEVRPGGTFNLPVIPMQRPVTVTAPSELPETNRAEQEKFLDSIGYKDLPIIQRRAIRKFMGSVVNQIRQTDLLPSEPRCWMGNHDPDEWKNENEDNFLWQATGKWPSGIELKKWGCEECARALSKAHPEAELSEWGF